MPLNAGDELKESKSMPTKVFGGTSRKTKVTGDVEVAIEGRLVGCELTN